MKQQLNQLQTKLVPLRNMAYQHRIVLFVIAVSSIYGFMLVRINNLANIEPDQAAVDAKIQEIKQVKIDDNAIKQIEDLESRNIDVEALFDNGRENPFQE